MTLRKKTSCLILAAGLSRRLGFDKASIMLNGAPLVSHMAEMMEKQGLETVSYTHLTLPTKNEVDC